MKPQQSYENHRRFDKQYIIAALASALAAILSIGQFGYVILQHQSLFDVAASAGQVILAVSVMVLFLKCRVYALIAQDRAIVLEVTDRYRRLGGSEKRLLTEVLTYSQTVALRFAPDEELVALTDKAIAENPKADEIKRRIKNWRPDNRRV